MRLHKKAQKKKSKPRRIGPVTRGAVQTRPFHHPVTHPFAPVTFNLPSAPTPIVSVVGTPSFYSKEVSAPTSVGPSQIVIGRQAETSHTHDRVETPAQVFMTNVASNPSITSADLARGTQAGMYRIIRAGVLGRAAREPMSPLSEPGSVYSSAPRSSTGGM